MHANSDSTITNRKDGEPLEYVEEFTYLGGGGGWSGKRTLPRRISKPGQKSLSNTTQLRIHNTNVKSCYCTLQNGHKQS